MKISRLIAAMAVAVSFSAASTGGARAAVVDMTTSCAIGAGDVSGLLFHTPSGASNAGCGIGSTAAPLASDVNADGAFGIGDWAMVALDPGQITFLNAAQTAGSFDLSALSADNIMIVLTSGGIENYVAYLLNAAQTAIGQFSSPFADTAGGSKLGGPINDARVFASTVAPVPVPAALPLFVAAMGGLMMLGRRNRAA